ncbi:MAG: hypothetical protein ACPGTP_09660 [Bacteroidia bacterium]
MLKSKNAYQIKTIDGDKELHILAEIQEPIVDNLNKTISFTSRYYALYEKVVRESVPAELDELGIEITPEITEIKETKTVELHSNHETYQEAQIEALYAQIKPLLPQSSRYFKMVNDPINIAFTFTVKGGNFFDLKSEDWEEVTND